MTSRRILLLAPLVALVAACATQPATAPASVADTIAGQPELSTFNNLVIQAGLADTLKAAGPYTVFAPTNDAFKALPAKTRDALASDPALLKSVLGYHVATTRVTAAEAKDGKAPTINGATLGLAKAGDYLTVEDALVQQADMQAANGVVHTVDRVLQPPKKK